jgi:putative effector of murein hydrolase LrgA (UPF0299 family)
LTAILAHVALPRIERADDARFLCGWKSTAMLKAFGILLTCQLAGEALARAVALPMPGPVIGLVMLLVLLFAVERRHLVEAATVDDTALGRVANGLLAVLGILFVPAGVGVIQNLGLLGEYGVALLIALVVSTVLTLVVTVWVFVGVSRLVERDG